MNDKTLLVIGASSEVGIRLIEAIGDDYSLIYAHYGHNVDELDKLINEKYAELDRAANDQKAKEKELENNKKILAWIETCQKEINEMLDM